MPSMICRAVQKVRIAFLCLPWIMLAVIACAERLSKYVCEQPLLPQSRDKTARQ